MNKTNQRLQKKFDDARAKLQKMEEAERRVKYKRKETEIEAENAILKKGVQEKLIFFLRNISKEIHKLYDFWLYGEKYAEQRSKILKEKQHEQTVLEEDLKKQLLESQNEKETLKAKLGEKEKQESQKKAESKARRILSFNKQELGELRSQVEDQTAEIDELKSKVQELKIENEKLTGLAGKSERKVFSIEIFHSEIKLLF